MVSNGLSVGGLIILIEQSIAWQNVTQNLQFAIQN